MAEFREVLTVQKPWAFHSAPGVPSEQVDDLERQLVAIARGERVDLDFPLEFICQTRYPREVCQCGMFDLTWE